MFFLSGPRARHCKSCPLCPLSPFFPTCWLVLELSQFSNFRMFWQLHWRFSDSRIWPIRMEMGCRTFGGLQGSEFKVVWYESYSQLLGLLFQDHWVWVKLVDCDVIGLGSLKKITAYEHGALNRNSCVCICVDRSLARGWGVISLWRGVGVVVSVWILPCLPTLNMCKCSPFKANLAASSARLFLSPLSQLLVLPSSHYPRFKSKFIFSYP